MYYLFEFLIFDRPTSFVSPDVFLREFHPGILPTTTRSTYEAGEAALSVSRPCSSSLSAAMPYIDARVSDLYFYITSTPTTPSVLNSE